MGGKIAVWVVVKFHYYPFFLFINAHGKREGG